MSTYTLWLQIIFILSFLHQFISFCCFENMFSWNNREFHSGLPFYSDALSNEDLVFSSSKNLEVSPNTTHLSWYDTAYLKEVSVSVFHRRRKIISCRKTLRYFSVKNAHSTEQQWKVTRSGGIHYPKRICSCLWLSRIVIFAKSLVSSMLHYLCLRIGDFQ